MPTDTVPELVEALRRFHLLEPSQYEEVLRALHPRLPDPKALARELIRRDWLTEYQAKQLLQGKGQELLLGSYVLMAQLGEGGMGAVFKARNWKLGQVVALKLMKQLNHPQLVQRFHREIRMAAQLDHPNIIRAYDADSAGDIHFLVMEFSPGIDLVQLVRQKGPLPVVQACDFILQAALGLQHAHERGLVHRDIKPANLLLAANNVIKILDMGLARLDDPVVVEQQTAELTRQGVVMGTVDYMAPEQAMNFHAADIRSDLYSLGCTFYYLLAGRVPFPGGEALARLMRHRQEEATPIDELRPDVPTAVAHAIHTLMAKAPDDRYQTAADLAAVLYQSPTEALPALPGGAVASTQELAFDTDPAGGPTEAGSMASSRTLRKRRPVWGLAWACGGVLLLLVLILLWVRPGQRSSPRVAPSQAAPAASETRSVWADRFSKLPVQPGAWDEVVEGLNGKTPPGLLSVVGMGKAQHWGPVQRITYSPDGQLVLTGGAEGDIKVWEAGTGRLQRTLQSHQDEIVLIGFSADGKTLISASKDSEIQFWDTASWEKRETLPIRPRTMTQAALSRDGKQLAAGLQDGKVRFWDLPALKERPTLPLHSGAITGLAFSPDGTLLASTGPDRDVKLWDLKYGQERARLPRPAATVSFLAFHPGGQVLAAGNLGQDGLVNLWDLETSEEIDEIKAWGNAWHGAFSQGGRWLATTGHNNETRLWDLISLRQVRARQGGALAFSPVSAGDSTGLATGPANTLELWDVNPAKARQRYPDYPHPIQCVASHPASQTVAWGLRNGTIQLLGPGDRPPHTIKDRHDNVDQLLFSPDGRLVASRGSDRRIRVWVVATDQLHSPPIPFLDVRGFAFTSDSTALLVWTQSNLRRWDLYRNQEITMAVGPNFRDARSMTLSSDGRLLALGIAGETIKALGVPSGAIQLWDLKAGQQKDLLTEQDGEARFLAFRPDGKELISNHAGSSLVKRWDLGAGKKQSSLKDSAAAFACAAFSPKGTVLATGHGDGAVRLWDPESGSYRETLQICPTVGKIVQLAFLDENHLVTVNSNGTLFLLQLSARVKA